MSCIFIRVRDGRRYLIETTKGHQKLRAYLGTHRSLPAAINALAEQLATQQALAATMDKRARDAARKYRAIWKPSDDDADMPGRGSACYVPSGPRAALLDYWDSRHDADQARKRAAKLKGRLLKLKQVAEDLERAGAGAG